MQSIRIMSVRLLEYRALEERLCHIGDFRLWLGRQGGAYMEISRPRFSKSYEIISIATVRFDRGVKDKCDTYYNGP